MPRFPVAFWILRVFFVPFLFLVLSPSFVACGRTQAIEVPAVAPDLRLGVSLTSHRARRALISEAYLDIQTWILPELDRFQVFLSCGTDKVAAGCVPLREAYGVVSRYYEGLKVALQESEVAAGEPEASAALKKARVYDTLQTLCRKLGECSEKIRLGQDEIRSLRAHYTDMSSLTAMRRGIHAFCRDVGDALRMP